MLFYVLHQASPSRCQLVPTLTLVAFFAAFVSSASVVIRYANGRTSTLKGNDKLSYTEFLAVPYGKITSRFKKSEFYEPSVSSETLNVTKYGSYCHGSLDNSTFSGRAMWNSEGFASEDCLNLNIWAPKKSGKNDSLLPVMVWIFGGGFFSGSSSLSLYNGSTLASFGNVLVVAINYRLGPFGFFYLNNQSAPGNVGLGDQQLALKWISGHIHQFGGDRKRVVIFGESAGAASVCAHLISADSRNLFSAAILQSGSITNPWATVTPQIMLDRSKQFAELFNCTENIVQCMQNVDAQVLIDHQFDMTVLSMHFPWLPITRDANFFPENMLEALDEGNIAKVPVLLGVNKDEGSYWLPYYAAKAFGSFDQYNDSYDTNLTLKESDKALINSEEYEQSISDIFSGHANISAQELKIIAEKYAATSVSQCSGVYRDGLSAAVGDFFFVCDVLKLIKTLQQNGIDTYFYEFVHRSPANNWPLWMGVMHGYEIEYIFGRPISQPYLYANSNSEKRLAREMMTAWTNMAKLGKPNAAETWTLDKPKLFGSGDEMAKRQMDLTKCDFWHKLQASGINSASTTLSTFSTLFLLVMIVNDSFFF